MNSSSSSSRKTIRRIESNGHMDSLPSSLLIHDILSTLDFETLCSVSCVSKPLRLAASQALSLFSSLDLSAFSPDAHLITQIFPRFTNLKTIALNCLRLDDIYVTNILGAHVEELKLLKCSSLSSHVLASIGTCCPNLRMLVLELADTDHPKIFSRNLAQLLRGCSHLESLSIKIRGVQDYADSFRSIELHLPQGVKFLRLRPILERNAISLIYKLGVAKYINHFIPVCPDSSVFNLQSLSLVLDVISDELIFAIANSLPFLLELDLEDRPMSQPRLPHDLTNNGLQSLSSCRRLISLSLIRSHRNRPVYFKNINDMGFFLLLEGCKNLESVRVGGLSIVSDAGFGSILQSCLNLKKFEVRNALQLSDLALAESLGGSCSLVELKLVSCSLLTSAFIEDINSSSTLEVLDLSGCRSVADACLSSVSFINTLNTLDLSGADVTDSGLAFLSKGNSPIARLCLRGCKRVTNEGISLLLNGRGQIRKTLSTLNIGGIRGISDEGIQTISTAALALSELSIRYCHSVTDASIEELVSESRYQNDGKLLRKLDLCHCIGLSAHSLETLKSPYFRALQWLGVGSTRLTEKGDAALAEICRGRPCLTLCQEGCEVGCDDGWQFHRSTRG
ncbi:F-box protein At-B [Daucus carota subsp. sativus]|uniref:F-box protein At-B n=1 Tax=Daucus carota subsp. sativus TaxID=79200 RepID=UPI0007EFCDCB|nr:PREDICTED: F-box protein At-B [Daucus carota subsp. sativus]